MFADPSAETRAQGKKGGRWIYVTHHLAEAQQVLQALHGYCGQADNRPGVLLTESTGKKTPQAVYALPRSGRQLSRPRGSYGPSDHI